MTRLELLQHIVHKARGNGFELRRWFRIEVALPWPGGDGALQWLSLGSRAHLLLLSQSFAQTFFGGPERLRQVQPATVFERTAPNGVKRTVHRRAYSRAARYNEVWRYHLQRMATSPDPLRYAQRFLLSTEGLLAASSATIQDIGPAEPSPHYDDELLVQDE